MNKKIYYSLGAVALALFIILTIIVKLHYTHSPMPYIDPYLQTAAWHLQDNTFLIQVSSIVAVLLGDALGAVVALIIIGALFIKDKVSAIWLALVSGIAVGGNALIKLIIGRERPELHRFPAFFDQTGKSFASGHTTFAVVLFGCLFFILLQYLTSIWSKYLAGLVTLFLIFLTMFSRVLLWVHYPSDTLGGLLWGISIICFTYPTYLHYKKTCSSSKLKNTI
ncbi:phosphatase PAP2 family protein [Lactococcus ileimucosae]|uniref:phosphatase PAP2 family protein n=1 Tax=Lactococcus ileimucosae TaxID=2941329 RepID=UPI003515DBE1